MKKLVLFLFIVFQSCMSYHTIPLSEIEEGKQYAFHFNNAKRDIKVKVNSNNIESDTFYLVQKNKILKISKENIAEVKKKKFSFVKTLTTVSLVTIGAIWYVNQADEEDTLTEVLIGQK